MKKRTIKIICLICIVFGLCFATYKVYKNKTMKSFVQGELYIASETEVNIPTDPIDARMSNGAPEMYVSYGDNIYYIINNLGYYLVCRYNVVNKKIETLTTIKERQISNIACNGEWCIFTGLGDAYLMNTRLCTVRSVFNYNVGSEICINDTSLFNLTDDHRIIEYNLKTGRKRVLNGIVAYKIYTDGGKLMYMNIDGKIASV